MKRVIGGFMCAMNNCNENSGVNDHHLSFFRFPSYPERARLWLQACGIKKNISSQKLYNNYRVCSKHFASHMFLNDLKNRLQPHAVPSIVFDTNEESTTTQNKINKNIIETSIGNSTNDIEANMSSAVAMCSTSTLTDVVVNTNLAENINVSNNDQTFKNDKTTQTELKLSHSTPRKVALRRKCDAAEKRAKRAKLKFKDETIEDITFNDFQKLLYKFYPKPIADFMKVQADLNKKKNELFLDD